MPDVAEPRPMRFLILTQYYPPEIGAAQARLSSFAAQLVAAGHDVEVVTALPNYPSGRLHPSDRWRVSRREVRDGIPVRRLALLPATGAGTRRLASYLSFAASGLIGSLAARRPDVVFVESPPLFLGPTGWAIARRFGARFVLNVSDLWPDSVRELGLMRDGAALRAAERLEHWLYERADAVTAVTEGIRERLVRDKGVPPRKVLFLPNGADTDVLRPIPPDPALRASLGLPEGPMVLYAGTHGYAHALDTLILAAEHVPEVAVVLVGSGSEKGRIASLAAARGVSNVTFLDPVPSDAIAGLYAHAVAGVSTLRDAALLEGARPAKTLAIMSCAKPVIYSGAGEGAELVRAADAGLIVPPEDPEALAAALRQVVADPAEAARMGASGRRYIEENLSWPALTRAWLREFADLTK